MGASSQDLWSSEGAIQLHDATLGTLIVEAGGVVSIELEGVTRYRPAGEGRHDVLVHPARLTIRGVTAVSVQGTWAKGDDDYVLDDEVIDVRGEAVPWLGLADRGLRRIRLSIFSGAVIEIECAGAGLELSGEGELVGQWDGERLL